MPTPGSCCCCWGRPWNIEGGSSNDNEGRCSPPPPLPPTLGPSCSGGGSGSFCCAGVAKPCGARRAPLPSDVPAARKSSPSSPSSSSRPSPFAHFENDACFYKLCRVPRSRRMWTYHPTQAACGPLTLPRLMSTTHPDRRLRLSTAPCVASNVRGAGPSGAPY